MFVVIDLFGSVPEKPINQVFGPFETADEAEDFAIQELGSDYWVAEVETLAVVADSS